MHSPRKVNIVARLRGSVTDCIIGIVPIVQSAQSQLGKNNNCMLTKHKYNHVSWRWGVGAPVAGLSWLHWTRMTSHDSHMIQTAHIVNTGNSALMIFTRANINRTTKRNRNIPRTMVFFSWRVPFITTSLAIHTATKVIPCSLLSTAHNPVAILSNTHFIPSKRCLTQIQQLSLS